LVDLVQPGVADSNYQTVSALLGKWASRKDQTGVVVGPTSSTVHADYLLNVMVQPFTLKGVPQELFPSATMSHDLTVQGFNPQTGLPCSLTGAGLDQTHCIRGAVLEGVSVMKRPLLFKNIEFNTFFDTTLPGYNATIYMFGSIPSPKIQCRPTTTLGNLFSQAGIYAYNKGHDRGYSSNATIAQQQRVADQYVTDPGNYQKYSFFLPARDQAGQADKTNIWGPTGPQFKDRSCFGPCDHPNANCLDPMDCCMTTSFTAAACYHQNHLGSQIIPVTAYGNVTLFIDSWNINLTSVHQVDVAFTEAILDFQISDPTAGSLLNWDCKDIDFDHL